MKMKRSLLTLLFLALPFGAAKAQDGHITATGVVVSAPGNEPVIAANVIVTGTPGIGAVTDANGRFSVKVPAGTKSLTVSSLGYASQQVPVKSGEIRVVLNEQDRVLDQVVVVAYGQQKKSSLTGAATNVKASSLTAAKVESVDKALAGKVAGLRVSSQTGTPGAAGTIQVRGVGSINGTTEPLYVVDGVPITVGNYGIGGLSGSTLSTINSEDIESISVLKDAASAALYGSRAANGVVLITTKQGRQGKTRFTLNASTGFSHIATNSYELMNANEHFDYTREAFINRYLLQKDALLPTGANYAQRAALRDSYAATLTDKVLAESKEVFVNSRTTRTDWRKELLGGTGRLNDLSLSASGGTEALRYFASLGYNDATSVTPYGSFKRYSGALNVDNKATKWLDLAFKGQVSYTRNEGSQDNSVQRDAVSLTHPVLLAFVSRPSEAKYNADGSLNTNVSPMTKGDSPISRLSPDSYLTEVGTLRGTGNASARIRFTDYLSLKTTNAIEYTFLKGFQYISPLSSDGARQNGTGQRLSNELVVKTTSNVLNFDRDFAEHHVDALAGVEAQSFDQLRTEIAVNQYATTKLKELGNAQFNDGDAQHFGSFLLSYLGRVNYNYDGRYFAGISLRNDISSKLGRNNRSGIFYSLSAAWRFGRESFLKGNEFLTDAKLRASYGTNGNLPDAEYSWRSLYAFGGSYGTEPAISLSQLANLDLGWEKSRSVNIGLDLTFARRFSLSLEYFDKHTTDLLMAVPVSYNYAVDTRQGNSGELSNKGFEAELHATDLLSSKSLRWDLDFSLTKIRSRVESLPNGDIINGPKSLYIYRAGEDVYSFYLPTWLGVDPTTGLGRFLIDPTKPAEPSNITYRYDEAGRAPTKSAYPKVYGGLTNTLSYGGFTLSALVTYQFGGHLLEGSSHYVKGDGRRLGVLNQVKELVGNYWTPTNTGASNPLPIFNSPLNSGEWSTRTIYSTDFIRLKELSLSYSLPKKVTDVLRLSSLRLSLTANNLLYLYAATKDKELEVPINGFRALDVPSLRTISFGLNVGF